MFQLEAVAFQHSRPLLAHGFNLAWPCLLIVNLAGFFFQALGGNSAGGYQNMGVYIPMVVAALGRVYGAIGGDLIPTHQPQAKRL